MTSPNTSSSSANLPEIYYTTYSPSLETQYLPAIRTLISQDLSEPYSIYVYHYFLYEWADLCFMALDKTTNTLIGIIINKLEPHRGGPLRGYIAMLAVRREYRGNGIATTLVKKAIDAMRARDADEIALETEVTNGASLKLYENLGFLRSKRLHRYYLNGNTAFRLLLYLKPGTATKKTYPREDPDPNLCAQDSDGYASVEQGDEKRAEQEIQERMDYG